MKSCPSTSLRRRRSKRFFRGRYGPHSLQEQRRTTGEKDRPAEQHVQHRTVGEHDHPHSTSGTKHGASTADRTACTIISERSGRTTDCMRSEGSAQSGRSKIDRTACMSSSERWRSATDRPVCPRCSEGDGSTTDGCPARVPPRGGLARPMCGMARRRAGRAEGIHGGDGGGREVRVAARRWRVVASASKQRGQNTSER